MGAVAGTPPLPGKFLYGEFVGSPTLRSAWIPGQPVEPCVGLSLSASVLGAEALLSPSRTG